MWEAIIVVGVSCISGMLIVLCSFWISNLIFESETQKEYLETLKHKHIVPYKDEREDKISL